MYLGIHLFKYYDLINYFYSAIKSMLQFALWQFSDWLNRKNILMSEKVKVRHRAKQMKI